MTVNRLWLIVLTLTFLSACSSLKERGVLTDNSDEYKAAKEHSELVIPPELDSSKVRSIYEIPNILGGSPLDVDSPNLEVGAQPAQVAKQTSVAPSAADTKLVDMPKATVEQSLATTATPKEEPEVQKEPALSLRVAEGAGYQKAVKINKLGTRYWILSQYSKASMDAALKDFFATQNLEISEQNSARGLYATAWKKRASVSAYEQFIFKLRPGLQFGTTELEVVELSAGSPSANVAWDAASSIKAREVDMLKRVAKFLSGVSAPLSGRYGKQNSNLAIKNAKQTYLRLGIDYTRAWAAVQEAIKKASYTIEQRDSTRGLIFVTSTLEQQPEKSGFFSRLSKKAPAKSFVVSVKAIAGKNASAILLQSPSGNALSKSQTQDVLKQITYYIN